MVSILDTVIGEQLTILLSNVNTYKHKEVGKFFLTGTPATGSHELSTTY